MAGTTGTPMPTLSGGGTGASNTNTRPLTLPTFNNIDDINKYAAQNWNSLNSDQQNQLHQNKETLAAQQGYKTTTTGDLINSSGVDVGRTIPIGTPQTGTTGTTTNQTQNNTGGSTVDGQWYPTLNGSLATTMLQAAKNPTPSTANQDYGVLNGTKVANYEGRTFTTLSDLVNSTGIQYKQDPTTGALVVNGHIVNPIGHDKSGEPIVYVRQFLTAAGVPNEQIKYDDKTHQISYQAPQQQDQSMYQSPLPSLMANMPQAPQIQPYQAPDLSGYYSNLMPVQQQFNPDWNGYYNQAHNVYDPLSQTQINTLMNKQGMDITKADEGLNAKGIFNSGIAVQMEDQIRANTNDQVAKVLMTAQSNMAKYAQQLYNDAYTQWNQGNANALKNNQMWLTQAMDQQKQSFQQWLDTQNLNQTQYKNALTAWDNVANLAQKDAQFQATQQLNYAKLAQQQYQFNNLSAYQQSTLSGYMPNGDPTLANVNNSRTYYDNLSKTSGYMIGPDGKPMLDSNGNPIPTEQARHDQATEQNAAQSNKIKFDEMMGYVTGPDGKQYPTLNGQKLQETINNDAISAQIKYQTAANNQDRTLLTKYNDELKTVQSRINEITTSGKYDLSAGSKNIQILKDLYTQEQSIMTNIDQIGNSNWSSYSGSKTPLSTSTMNNLISQALKITGVPATQANIDGIMNIAQHESSFQPGAYNPKSVRTANGDENATGLMQTLPSTFQANKISGYDDINNPLDNMIAAIRYMNASYGSPAQAWQFWQQNSAY